MADRQRAHDFQLNRLPQEMRLLGQAHIDPADNGGILRKDVDQAFFLQPHQRIAYRRRTDAELPGQRGARQRRSRRQIKRDDHAAQALENLGRRLTIAIQPLGGTQAGAARSYLRWAHRTNSHFEEGACLRCTNTLVHLHKGVNATSRGGNVR